MKKNWQVIYLNKNYLLRAGTRVFRCQIGSGDKTTPIGKWYLKSLFYRADQSPRPKLKKTNYLIINQITKNCGWCDDIKSNYYNKYIRINNSRSINTKYENLWREDNVYDIIIVISHNIKPTIKNKGSAIFIHCSFLDYRETAGCIALKKRDLIFIIKNLTKKVTLEIKNNF
jgi:L,D-peptidoglycan transpeptidase YkuD (ErfK/YbiS/YcfS/YnhG family)